MPESLATQAQGALPMKTKGGGREAGGGGGGSNHPRSQRRRSCRHMPDFYFNILCFVQAVFGMMIRNCLNNTVAGLNKKISCDKKKGRKKQRG